jgi:hypothetical protein
MAAPMAFDGKESKCIKVSLKFQRTRNISSNFIIATSGTGREKFLFHVKWKGNEPGLNKAENYSVATFSSLFSYKS